MIDNKFQVLWSPSPSSSDSGNGGGVNWNDALTRRSFLKRTGGATAATIISWHMTSAKVMAEDKQNNNSVKAGDSGWQDAGEDICRFYCSSPGDLAPGNGRSYVKTVKVTGAPFNIMERKGNNIRNQKIVRWEIECTIKATHATRHLGGNAFPGGYRKACALFDMEVKGRIVDVTSGGMVPGTSTQGPSATVQTNLALVRKLKAVEGGAPVWDYKISHAAYGDNPKIAPPVNNVKMTISQSYSHQTDPSDPKVIFPKIDSFDFSALDGSMKSHLTQYLGHIAEGWTADVSAFVPAPTGPCTFEEASWTFVIEQEPPTSSFTCA